MSHHDLLTRIKSEYREMPGLSLTVEQACRLWNLDRAACEQMLGTLVAEGSLVRTARGRFVALPRPRPLLFPQLPRVPRHSGPL